MFPCRCARDQIPGTPGRSGRGRPWPSTTRDACWRCRSGPPCCRRVPISMIRSCPAMLLSSITSLVPKFFFHCWTLPVPSQVYSTPGDWAKAVQVNATRQLAIQTVNTSSSLVPPPILKGAVTRKAATLTPMQRVEGCQTRCADTTFSPGQPPGPSELFGLSQKGKREATRNEQKRGYYRKDACSSS